MKLVDDWRRVLRHAWSVRLMLLSLVLSGLEVTVQVIVSWNITTPVPPGVFALLAGLVTVASGFARFTSQKQFRSDE